MGLLEKGKTTKKVVEEREESNNSGNKKNNKSKKKSNYSNLQGLDKKEHIHTKLDTIYDKIVKNKKIRISKLARESKCTRQDTENWLKLLQKQGLVEISYPTIGEAYVSVNGENEEDQDKKVKDTKKGKTKKLVYFTIFVIIIVTVAMVILKIYFG